jgi:hypothetical protein
MRNIQMNTLLGKPFSELTPEEVRELVRRAHWERSQVLRRFLVALFGRSGKQSRDAASHGSMQPAM